MMEIEVRFYTRFDFGGFWSSLMWLPVRWVQGEFVHVEIAIPEDDKLLNADIQYGVDVFKISGDPSRIYRLPVDRNAFWEFVNGIKDKHYSWESYVRLLIPRWGRDPKGFICSELVADALKHSCKHSLLQGAVTAVPPYRWTPNALCQALDNLNFNPIKLVSKTSS